MLNRKLPSIITSENKSTSWTSMLIIAKSNFFISATLYKYPKVKTITAKATRTAIATFFNISCYRKSTIRTICRNWL